MKEEVAGLSSGGREAAGEAAGARSHPPRKAEGAEAVEQLN